MRADQWPPQIQQLPRCPVRGLPVPHSSGFDEDGTGQFGINDPMLKLICGMGRLCGICGRPLGDGEIVFLVADRGPLASPVFTDPASHEDCAEASLQLCPAIARPGTEDGWQMWVTGSFAMVPGRNALLAFRPGPAARIRRFGYDGRGRLAELPQKDPACLSENVSGPTDPVIGPAAGPRIAIVPVAGLADWTWRDHA